MERNVVKRIDWIDSLRGLAMVMVVLGHCGGNEYFFKGLYYIHLPIFIVASGFWLDKSKKTIKEFTIHKAKQLMYPYFGFGLITVIFQYFRFILVQINYEGGSLYKLIANIVHLENFANWFLPVLFISSIVAFSFCKIAKRKRWYLYLICMILMASITSVCTYFLGFPLTKPAHFLISQIGKNAAFVFFLFTGVLLKQLILQKYTFHTKWAWLFFMLSIAILIFASNLPMCDLHLLQWENTGLFFTVALLGSVSFTLFFKTSNFTPKLLTFIGRNSLLINGTHLNLMITSLAGVITWNLLPKLAPLYNIGPALFTLVTLILEIIFVVPIMKLVYPFLWDFGALKSKTEKFREILKKIGGKHDA